MPSLWWFHRALLFFSVCLMWGWKLEKTFCVLWKKGRKQEFSLSLFWVGGLRVWSLAPLHGPSNFLRYFQLANQKQTLTVTWLFTTNSGDQSCAWCSKHIFWDVVDEKSIKKFETIPFIVVNLTNLSLKAVQRHPIHLNNSQKFVNFLHYAHLWNFILQTKLSTFRLPQV